MADNISRLFVPPSHSIPEIPNVGNDFYRMLSGIGDSIIAARERAPGEAFQERIKNAPRRADGSIDPNVIAGIAAEVGYPKGVTDFSTLGGNEARRALDRERLDHTKYTASPEYLREYTRATESPLARERFDYMRNAPFDVRTPGGDTYTVERAPGGGYRIPNIEGAPVRSDDTDFTGQARRTAQRIDRAPHGTYWNVPGDPSAGVSDIPGYGRKFDDETLTQIADQYLAGDKSVMQGLGTGRQRAEAVIQLRKRIAERAAERGMTSADITVKLAEFGGLAAGQRAVGTRAANLELAVEEAKQLIPPALEVSDRINRTQFPSINAIILAAQRGIGGEDVARFTAAVNSLVNVYARAIQPVGVPTDDSRRHAREILDKAYSKGQFRAAVDQLQIEMEAAQRSPSAVLEKFRKLYGGGKNEYGERPAGETKPGASTAPVAPAIKDRSAKDIPPSAIQYLRDNPDAAKQFDEKYGLGSARRVLGQQ